MDAVSNVSFCAPAEAGANTIRASAITCFMKPFVLRSRPGVKPESLMRAKCCLESPLVWDYDAARRRDMNVLRRSVLAVVVAGLLGSAAGVRADKTLASSESVGISTDGLQT